MRCYVVTLVVAVVLGAFGAANVGALGLPGGSDGDHTSARSAVEACTERLLLGEGAAARAGDAGEDELVRDAAETRCTGIAGAAWSATAGP